MRNRTMTSALSIWLMVVAAGTAQAQNSRQSSQSPIVRTDFIPASSQPSEMQQGMAKRANFEREQQMRVDTEKLLKLAEELKKSVGKTDQNILSIDVMKKANEIEKLAHSVKENMRGPN
jgi:hypothetical protein